MIRRRLSLRPLCAALLSATLLVGCVSLLPEPEQLTGLYTLAHPTDYTAVEGGDVDGPTLALGTPSAPRAYASDEIAVRAPDGGLKFLPGARWADTAPRLLQDLVLDQLARQGLTPAPLTAGVNPDYEITWRVRAFEADIDTPNPQARIVIDALVMEPERKDIQSITVTQERPISGDPNTAASIIDAMRSVARDAARTLAEDAETFVREREG